MSLIMGGAESFPFDNVGDGFTNALITEVSDEQHATDLDTGELRFWDPGKTQPVKQVVVSLELAQQDRLDVNDDGARSLFVQASSNRQKAVAAAVRAAGQKEFLAGGYLSMQYTGDGEKKNKGWNAPKLYRAAYVPPQTNGGNAIMGQEAAQAPQQQAAQGVQYAQQNYGQAQPQPQQQPVYQQPVQQQWPAQQQQAAQPQYAPQQQQPPAGWPVQQQAQAQPQQPVQQAPQQQQYAPQQAPVAPGVAPSVQGGLDMSGIPAEAQALIAMQQGQMPPQQ